jgi:hypothetical protein
MLHVAHPKLSSPRATHRWRRAPVAHAHVHAPPGSSNAAPLTLAAIVILDLLLAASVGIVTALGG